MFNINKTSHLVTVSVDIKLAELKKSLIKEGLYLGYHPLDENHLTLAYYLKSRVPNLYYFKYGSLTHQVSSIVVQVSDGKSFHLKDAPRAAIGPDFNSMTIGAKESFGLLQNVTLKLFAMPEKIMTGLVTVNSRDGAREFLRLLVGLFIPPLYFRYVDLDNATNLFKQLGINTAASEIVVFSLSGLSEIVTITRDIIEDFSAKNKGLFFFCDKKNEHEVLHGIIHTPEAYQEIKDQYRQFLWPASEAGSQTDLEKNLVKCLGVGPVAVAAPQQMK